MRYIDVPEEEMGGEDWVNRMVIADAFFCNDQCGSPESHHIPIVSHKHNCKSSSKPEAR